MKNGRKTGINTNKLIKLVPKETAKTKLPIIDPKAIAELTKPIVWDRLLKDTRSVMNPK